MPLLRLPSARDIFNLVLLLAMVKVVAVIGSGPAGLAAANQLNHRGYDVTVFEQHEYVGGLLRFGIPNFKLQKR